MRKVIDLECDLLPRYFGVTGSVGSCPIAVIWSEARSGTIPALNSPLDNLSAREVPLDEARERAGFGAGLSSGRKERP